MKIMTVRAPDKLINKLNSTALEKGATRNQLILQILWNWVEEVKLKTK